ncbi:hypothetical protein GQ53DRAFT_751105 [Thozetella sp. PMI_491]|nr:hypothetical protein GQ53DRAFT_751105 [Thozetella sp. PMI_491]
MRVRKSVPEGYKTGSAYGSFSLWADADARHNRTDGQPSLPRTSAAPAGLRELTPFCGIHKIGGLAVQPNAPPSYSFPAAAFQVMVDSAPSEDDDVPGLTSSQESAASTDSTSSSRLAPPPIYTAMAAVPSAATNRKRFFSDDEPGEAPGVHSEWRARDASWWDGEVSPRSLAPASWDNARVMAFPRRRSGKGAGRSAERPSAALAALGQENADMNMVVDAADFEDAPFLDFGWDERMDVE